MWGKIRVRKMIWYWTDENFKLTKDQDDFRIRTKRFDDGLRKRV